MAMNNPVHPGAIVRGRLFETIELVGFGGREGGSVSDVRRFPIS